MSDGYVKKLLDPAKRQAVLQATPIATGDLRKTVLQAKQTAGLFDYMHVPKAARISYFDLRPEAQPSEHLKLHIEDVSTSAQFTSWGKAKALRPLFYLPYLQNNTARMKLEQPATYAGDEVRFFTTAMIDGCSVYIEGPAATPKVTHINAQAIQPTRSTDSWAAKQVKIAAKIAAMDTRHAHVRKLAATVVERPDYIADDPAQLVQLKQRFATSRGIPVDQVMTYQPFGTVLGFKDGTDWSFWLQKNGSFEWKRNPAHTQRQWQVTYWVIEAREIWPNGAGAFRLIP